MKTLKASIIFLFLYCSNCSFLYAQVYNCRTEIALESYQIKTKDKTGDKHQEEIPIKRSIQIQPVYAYLNNHVVNIVFTKNFSTATVTIINKTTGEILHSETSANPTSFNIDLSSESNGNYIIEIEIDDTYLIGCFNL